MILLEYHTISLIFLPCSLGVLRLWTAAQLPCSSLSSYLTALATMHLGRHLLLDALQRRLVMNAMALGRAMRRKVIMPRMTCWCDRYWWLLEGCRFPGVSAEQVLCHAPTDVLPFRE